MSSDPLNNVTLKESLSPMNEQSNSSNPNSHKITTFFPVLRGEGRAKMCASKPGDTKQKEILQKLKSKDTMSLRPKNQDTKSSSEQSPKAELISQTKEKLRGNIMSSALKTPLSQVLRRNLEAFDNKKEQTDKSLPNSKRTSANKSQGEFSTLEKKESASESSVVERLRPSQKAKKSFPETELAMSLRRSQKQPSHATKSTVLRSGLKKSTDGIVNSATVDKKKEGVDPIETVTNRVASGTRISTQLSFSNSITTTSPVEDAEHAISNQSSNSSGKFKKNRKRQRHFRGATYGLFLSKKKRKIVKTVDESKDDNCSLAGTENSSYLDSDEGNSLMSEDMYTPSEKSLADEDHNPDSQNSSMLTSIDQKHNSSEIKPETVMKIEEDTQLESDHCSKIEENKVQPSEVSECNPSNQEVCDALQDLNEMHWEDSNNVESEKQFVSGTLKTSQYDDISNESFSNFCKDSPVESSEDKAVEVLPETDDKRDIDSIDTSQKIDSSSPATVKEEVTETCEDNADTTIYSDDQDEKQTTAVDSDDQDEKQTAVDSDDQDEKQTAVDSDDQDEKQTAVDSDDQDEKQTAVDSDDQDEKQTAIDSDDQDEKQTAIDSDDQDEKQTAVDSDDQDEKQTAVDSDDQDEKQTAVDSDDQDEKQTTVVDSDDQDEKQTNVVDSDDQDEKQESANYSDDQDEKLANAMDSDDQDEKQANAMDSDDQDEKQANAMDSDDQDEKQANAMDSDDQDEKQTNAADSDDQDEKQTNAVDSDDQDEKHTIASVKSGDEQENENVFSPEQSPEIKDPNDAHSTIATCVKSRQRIKRRFTDDIVDTEMGLLSINPSIPATRKAAAPRPDPPKDVIETFQSVTHSEAKKGPITKIECIFNSRQPPVMSCTCEGDTYEANLGSDDEGVFCQAVDSIDDKLVGCSNPVVTTRLVRSSVKIPFTIMCEMHLWRLKHHHSCPYCGLFCSQGSFIQCVSTKNKRRVVHLYHEQCQSKEEGIGTFCLHCGATSDLKRVTLEMHMASPPSFFLSQLTNLPLPHVAKARMSIASAAERMKDDEIVDFSFRIPDTGKVLSSVGLKSGPEKDELEKLLQMLNDTKEIPNYHTHEEFYTASGEGDLLKVLNILARGIDPNLKFLDHEDDTALHAAAANGQTTVVHLLIQAGAVNDSLNERLYTPLMLAVENNHQDVVFYLIKNGALADFKGENGMSSFHMAAKNGNLEILKILMSSRNVDINSQDDGGWTPIVWASEHDHYEVVKYLLKRGANPNIKDSEGNTGLHWSAFSGSVDISYLYLDYGCDINATNERGDTPLHIAARQDALSCVTLFLSRGADVQIRNKNNQLPAECVIDKTSDTYLSLSLNMLLKKIAGKYQHRAEKILHKDISRGKEQIAIPCVNEVDDEPPPLDFLYVTENCETTPLNIDRTITSLQSCHCEDDCSSSNCVCSSISYQCWYDKEGLLLPNFNLVDPPMLFECNRACSCWALSCRNRVLQNGITCRLQLIRTKGKGWGVRTLKDIPKGTFICEYVGEMISDSAADKRADDSYLFDLDNRDGETYCLDARYYGNISRFINHLCEPNLVPVKIYVDHQDLNFPRIAFFSSREIKQYEELGFDYCEKFWVIKYKYFTCDCGSAKCKYSKDTIHNTLANYYRRVKEEQQLEEGTLQPTSVPEA